MPFVGCNVSTSVPPFPVMVSPAASLIASWPMVEPLRDQSMYGPLESCTSVIESAALVPVIDSSGVILAVVVVVVLTV